jgi:LPXTG-site transpeptidase (sortase) family protein
MPTVPQAPPTRLKIPSIGVDAAVGQIARTKDPQGDLGLNPPEEIWEDLARAYWWNERQAPGNPTEGTTFILGHTCHRENCPAVFNRLQSVRLGALIVVETRQGTLTYKVWKIRDFPEAMLAGNEAVNADHLQGLTLITCKLRADGGVQTTRRVVWAKLVDTRQK